jgi:hypothetical protein
MRASRTVLAIVIWLLAAYAVMQISVSAATAIAPVAPTRVPAVVVEAMEPGTLYCPEHTSVYTRTQTYGFAVYCK